MLTRRMLTGLVVATACFMTVPAHAATPAPTPAATTPPVGVGLCSDPTSVRCDISAVDTSTTPPTGAKAGTQEPGWTHIVCHPLRAPGIPMNVDCNTCLWTASDVASALAGLYKDLVPASAAAQVTGGSTLYQTQCWTKKYNASYLEPVYDIKYVVLPPGTTPPVPGVPAADLAWEGSDKFVITTPAMRLAPGGESYVNLRTFLWLEGGWGHWEATATDTIKTVRVTADAYKVDWDLTEGTVTCAGPGTPWDPAGAEDQVTDCGYTYRATSAGQPNLEYPVRATIYYRLAWTCAGAGCTPATGTLRDKWISSVTMLKVAERQAVVTNSGGGTS